MAVSENVLAAIEINDDARPGFFNAAAGETLSGIGFLGGFDVNDAWASELSDSADQAQLSVENVSLLLELLKLGRSG